jgi:hypothetical protein
MIYTTKHENKYSGITEVLKNAEISIKGSDISESQKIGSLYAVWELNNKPIHFLRERYQNIGLDDTTDMIFQISKHRHLFEYTGLLNANTIDVFEFTEGFSHTFGTLEPIITQLYRMCDEINTPKLKKNPTLKDIFNN